MIYVRMSISLSISAKVSNKNPYTMDRIRIHPNTELQLSLNNVHTSAGAAKASPKRKAFYNPHPELRLSHY